MASPPDEHGRTVRRTHGDPDLICPTCGRRLDTGFIVRERPDPETGRAVIAWICPGCGHRTEEIV